MYIIYKTKLQDLGFEYKMHTTFGDFFFLFQHTDGMYEIVFHDSQDKRGSILLDSNEAEILSRLLDPEQRL
ncbi:hypothetical protein [Oceanobacillus jeddahense]|uniref:Potassium/proton antiporter subunit KhtT-like N-terminal domain-containing protein n=1 Tax=Oceanobacillus jeddahense TaxID=1462527 RepID=A0ABY5JLI8_9BACI|nr:hypothetical protein [Oceanobacillus jeddahense]UUI01169.1 hypothetical protein NP439_13975 [Oceanobacillus jeddahense]